VRRLRGPRWPRAEKTAEYQEPWRSAARIFPIARANREVGTLPFFRSSVGCCAFAFCPDADAFSASLASSGAGLGPGATCIDEYSAPTFTAPPSPRHRRAAESFVHQLVGSGPDRVQRPA
jgi:hypothetical protein